jgi:hypothetical protein
MPIDFNAKADEFIARVQAADITATTEVELIFHLLDQSGAPLPPVRRSITGTVSVQGGPSKQFQQAFARSQYIQQIIDNINSLVRHCPTTPIMMPETGRRLVTVQDIEMEITDPGP